MRILTLAEPIDAIPANELRRIVREAIEEWIDPDALETAREAEAFRAPDPGAHGRAV